MGNSRLLLAVVLILAILAIARSRVFRGVLEAIASVELEPESWETPAEFMPTH